MFCDKHIELKGTHQSMTAILLKTADLSRIERSLESWTQLAPAIFNETFVIIDAKTLNRTLPSQFLSDLKNLFHRFNIFLAGVRNVCEHTRENALNVGIPVLTIDKKTKTIRKGTQHPTLVINKHIRAGQQTRNTKGDIIICGHVSSTAEVVSTQNIVIIGALRGRAIAGVSNQTDATIICSSFAPELISVAGVYLTCENIPQDKIGKAVHVSLQKGKLVLTEIKINQKEIIN